MTLSGFKPVVGPDLDGQEEDKLDVSADHNFVYNGLDDFSDLSDRSTAAHTKPQEVLVKKTKAMEEEMNRRRKRLAKETKKALERIAKEQKKQDVAERQKMAKELRNQKRRQERATMKKLKVHQQEIETQARIKRQKREKRRQILDSRHGFKGFCITGNMGSLRPLLQHWAYTHGFMRSRFVTDQTQFVIKGG